MGAIIRELPEYATEMVIGDSKYYVFLGVYYKPFFHGDQVVYVVSRPPVGVMVKSLPEGATAETVNGKAYFVYGGVYYQIFQSGNDTMYLIVAPPSL